MLRRAESTEPVVCMAFSRRNRRLVRQFQAVKMAFRLTMTMSWNGMMNHRPRLGPKAYCTARTPF